VNSFSLPELLALRRILRYSNSEQDRQGIGPASLCNSIWRQAVMTEAFRGFIRSLQANFATVASH
jgi:hypothetical protein